MKFTIIPGNVVLSKTYSLPAQQVDIIKDVLPSVAPLMPIPVTFLSEDKEHLEINLTVPCPEIPLEVCDLVVASIAAETIMDGIVHVIVNSNKIHKIFLSEINEQKPQLVDVHMHATESKGKIVRNALVECFGMPKDQANNVVFNIPGLLIKNVPMNKVDLFMKVMEQAGLSKHIEVKSHDSN